MVKIKIEIELEEDQIKEIFESYDKKFTKKKLAELKRAIREGEIDFPYELEDDITNVLGNYIDSEFDD